MTQKNKVSGIQSLEIGLNILEILANQKEPLKFSDIQNLTSMTKSNLYKYLSTLHQFGMIYRDPQTNSYSLGQKLIKLGNIALGQSSLIEIVIPYLKKINEYTKLTSLLAIPSIHGPLITYISSPDYGINIGAQIGTTLPLSSSTGVVYSAFKSLEVENWLEEEIKKFSKIEFQQHQIEIEKTRNLLFASKTEPLVEHVSSFSVPILNFKKELIGAITIVGYTDTVPKSIDAPISRYVIKIANEISGYFGYSEII